MVNTMDRMVNYVYSQGGRSCDAALMYTSQILKKIPNIFNPSYCSFIELLAEKDITTACKVVRNYEFDGMDIVWGKVRVNENKLFDEVYVINCLLLNKDNELITYLKSKIDIITVDNIKMFNNILRKNLEYSFVIKFLRCLNHAGCEADFVDDVFYDCPIGTADVIEEENLLCNELYERNKFEFLYDYLSNRGKLIQIVDKVGAKDWYDIEDKLNNNLNLGAVAILLFFCYKGKYSIRRLPYILNMIDLIKEKVKDKDVANILVLYCCLRECELSEKIHDSIRKVLETLSCEHKILIKYRKYIGHQEISTFKVLLTQDKELLDLLELLQENNTFNSQYHDIMRIDEKQKKYVTENQNFMKILKNSEYTFDEQQYIINNTHMRLYCEDVKTDTENTY